LRFAIIQSGFSDRAATTAQRKNPSSEKEKEAAVK